MYLLSVVLIVVIPIVINGYAQMHWIEDGGICYRDYGPNDHCIHYANCLSGEYGTSKKGRTEFCRFSGTQPTLCCVNVEDDSSEEDCSEEVYTFSVDPNEDFSHHYYHNQHHSYGGDGSTKPWNKPHENNHQQHVGSKPPMGWDWDKEANYGGSSFHPHQNVPKPYPPKQNVKPVTTKPQQPTQGIPSAATTTTAATVPTTTTTTATIPTTTTAAPQTAGGDQQRQQNAPQSPPTTADNPELQANNDSNVNTTSTPFYRPTLQNSTSLQKCRDYFQAIPLLKGPHTPIVGGRDAKPKEFPHLAILGYGDADNVQWGCGGSLISEQFVLTAAHCLRDRIIGPVQYVRLGELDLNSTAEDSDVRDFTISQTFRHPMYRFSINYYDIALLRLNASAMPFNRYIRPACLPTTLQLDGRILVAAGWGLLEEGGVKATILQRATLKHVPNDRCRNIYGNPRNFRNGIVEEILVCADGGGERRDACQGDSGGPLQLTNYDYFTEFTGFVEVVGITSFGKGCGQTAGVYTRVLPFVDWIEKIVWPNN